MHEFYERTTYLDTLTDKLFQKTNCHGITLYLAKYTDQIIFTNDYDIQATLEKGIVDVGSPTLFYGGENLKHSGNFLGYDEEGRERYLVQLMRGYKSMTSMLWEAVQENFDVTEKRMYKTQFQKK